MTRSVRVRAAAKINLHLGVGAPRADGFHPLATVYQAVSLYDDLTAWPSPDHELHVAGADHVATDDVPAGPDNIVARAAHLLERHHGVHLGASIVVHKEIPVAGGLAGGSADAAATLVLLDRLWGLGTDRATLLRIAAELGSDVPFALLGGSALGTGRGEVVAPVPDPGTWWWVAVPFREGLSTPAVYRHWDRLLPDASPTPAAVDRVLAALSTGDPATLAAALHNDLQVAACDLRPSLAGLIRRGEAEGALRGIVSGSGPTCVFLCEDQGCARSVAEALRDDEHPVSLVATGPVAGAHVVGEPA